MDSAFWDQMASLENRMEAMFRSLGLWTPGRGRIGMLPARPFAPAAAHMTPTPATAEPGEDSVAVANRTLDLGVRHLPLVESGQVVGMVSAADLLALVAWPGRPPNDRVAVSA